ncbi:hypothetical protein NDN08_002128 [Rhodosorus marinus]|uniref:Uncharacterized protein n=1 Tax=Rhodosorus marinus TaxID=101924 RepID=A0AAV8UX88_9RHOD|nr:hypothetical protein NDN08_002128 [Rhodosorus marinus]
MPASLTGKVVIVTGASAGIGEGVALGAATAGAKVVVVARSADKLDALVKQINEAGGEATSYVGDVGLESTAKGMVEKALSTFGALHAAFLNAGYYGKAPITELDVDMIDTVLNVNVKSVILGIKHCLPAMKETSGGTGSIIVNSSTMASAVTTGLGSAPAIYAASKAAASMIMKYAAVEAAPDVRVNAIGPGVIKTAMTDFIPSEEMENLHLLKRAGRVDEVVPLVTYLASDESSLVTGSEMIIDAGWAIQA